jgi:tetratricopeptide (TPR) repeat protein
MSEELRALIRSSTAELDSWLSQEIQDELGTRAFILRAIAWCRRGALARARADVDAALAKLPAHEIVELTGAMILFVTHDYDRAVSLLDGVARRHRYMAAQTLRVLVSQLARLGWTVEQRMAQQQLAALGVRDLRAHIQGLQQRRGAGTGTAEQAWARLYEHGLDDVESRLAILAEAAPRSIELAAVRARVSLLRGDLDEAANRLAAWPDDEPQLLEERMALALARGQLDAVADSPADPRGAWSWRLRGEALLGLGRREEARAALQRAAELEPDHATTELLRTLADDRDPSVERFLELDALATGLLSDAARELDVTLWVDGGLLDDPPTLARVCAHARSMLTADRSTPISYRSGGEAQGQLRHLAEPAIARKAHADDAADLGLAAKLLVRAIEKHRGTAHRATAARSLDAAQIDAFMADGYVHLRGAFPRELAASIVASAHRRLRENPAKCLLPEQAKREADQLARCYDPEDPSTWPEGRLDVEGERRFTISEFSPFAERAVFQLLGDAARVRTRSWTSNLIVQYPVRGLTSWIPAPDHQSWHLDSPSTQTRIDELRTGLLVFIVFSDLLPDSGNSWLALDSPAKVARKLAGAPEGIDFCSDHAGCAITRTCERFFELTGEAGDLFLVHPLMLHSASLNPSPRIRFLGNPMVYMQEPLDPRRPELSPVERLIARALE